MAKGHVQILPVVLSANVTLVIIKDQMVNVSTKTNVMLESHVWEELNVAIPTVVLSALVMPYLVHICQKMEPHVLMTTNVIYRSTHV